MGNFKNNIIMSGSSTETFVPCTDMTADNFTCGNQGYKCLVQKIVQNLLAVITANVSIIRAILWSDNLKKAFMLVFNFLTGSADWIGYVIAAVYYFGLEFGYADLLCQFSGYGFTAVYWLNMIATFGQ